MNLPTKIGVTYVVTDVADCTVTDSNGVVLCEHSGGSEQSQFTATTMSVSIDSTTASVRETFNHAPAGNVNGGGSQPASPKVTELIYGEPATLEDGRVYHVVAPPDDGFDLQELTVAPNATARIWVDGGTGCVIFPPDWVWSDSSEFQLPAGTAGGVGDFVDGETYLITVCRYKYDGKDFTLAHRALTIKPAQA